ncbi:cytochrome P450 20A1-like [Glandiceps talaboti]
MAGIVVIAVAAIVVVIAIYYLKSVFLPEKVPSDATSDNQMKALIPGMKKSDPEKGNLPDIDEAGGFHEFLVKLHSNYGPVASFWYGKTYSVSLGSPEAFKDHIKLFDRPPELFEFVLPLVGKDSIQYANAEDGKERRRTYDAPFSHEAIRNYFPNFQKAAEDMVKKILLLPPGDHIPITEYMSVLVIRAISNATFGDFFDDDKKAVSLLHHYETTFATLNKLMTGDIDKPEGEEFDQALKNWHDFMREAVQHRRDNPPGEQECTFIDVLIESCPTEDRLLADALSYFIASYHTTNFMMVWAMYYLTKDCEVQDKVYEEIMNVLGEDDLVDHETLPKLVYTKQVFDEVMRCSALATMAARVDYERDTKVLGYTIPKGTAVVHALGVVLLDPKVWPDPERFDPDRFSPEEVSKRHPLAFSVFGFAGKRICPGYRIAYAEATVFLVALLRKFKFHLVEGQNIQHKFGFVTLPSDEIWLTASERNLVD